MEGVRNEVPGLLGQILGGELVMLEGLPDERIRCEASLLSGRRVDHLPLFYGHIPPLEYTVVVVQFLHFVSSYLHRAI